MESAKAESLVLLRAHCDIVKVHRCKRFVSPNINSTSILHGFMLTLMVPLRGIVTLMVPERAGHWAFVM